ncbi:flavoprotein [Tenuifilaceae bacterium CYCD]|nr:flavoprotein [Tenuifilaceae bacterium CYCD]
MRVAIIGGGAAGFFAAITAKENFPDAEVMIFEKAQKVLSKVKVSGGGRCNVTNGCETVDELITAYPRGKRQLKKAFYTFSNFDAIKWFESRGVPLVTQSDNCIFPKSQDSQSIIDCFLRQCKKLNIKIKTGRAVKSVNPQGDKLRINFRDDENIPQEFDKVIVTTGGSSNYASFKWIEDLGHKIEKPIPSLFTFNIPNNQITELMGIVVENTLVSIQGTKIKSDGSVLITHWGMSGPAILKLSSFGARILNEMNYNFNIQVNWTNEQNSEYVVEQLNEIVNKHPNKILSNIRPYSISERLWLYLLMKSELSEQKKWCELGKKGVNKLANTITNDIYSVKGKSTFREEFVTCGGVSLQSIDMNAMQSKTCKNLYFAGEVLDIDAITGGYNLQAAWTTGFIAGKLLE